MRPLHWLHPRKSKRDETIGSANQMELIPAETLGPIVAAGESACWPHELISAAGFVGLDSWSRFVETMYGFRVHRLAVREGQQPVGLLGLCHVKHPILGDYLTTAPFASYGGFAFSSVAARDALLAQARRLARESAAQYVNVRFDGAEAEPPEGWSQQPIYATYQLDLRHSSEDLLASYGSDHRNHVRKSLKKGFSVRFGGMELLDDAYEGLARSMHELGSPYHSKTYLRRMVETLSTSLELAAVYGPSKELVGAGVFITHGDVVTNLHANILRRFRPAYAGEFLYWSAIRRYAEKGLRLFDLGRSLIGSGNETFKLKWKPSKRALAYWYALNGSAGLPELNQKNPRFQAAIWLWKRLPPFVVRPIGPFFIKGLA